MKKIKLLFFASFLAYTTNAQVTVTPNLSASQIANTLVASSGTLGVTLSNATLVCDSSANGEFSGPSNLGINNGIVLGNGSLLNTGMGIGILGNPSNTSTSALGAAGDASLNAIISANTFDACVLEFDLQPVGNFVEFEYVFGSDEYPAFNCSVFNDVFGFFITGPGYTTPTNIALIPGTTTPVSINSINDGSVSTCGDTTYYVENTDTIYTINGFTTPLLATATVTPGQTYHLKLAIADVLDQVLNSFVFLKANSLRSGNSSNPTIVNTVSKSNNQFSIYPTQIENQFTFKNKNAANWKLNIIDVNGRSVYKTYISSSNALTSIELNNLTNGMYFVQTTNLKTGETFSEKIIKE